MYVYASVCIYVYINLNIYIHICISVFRVSLSRTEQAGVVAQQLQVNLANKDDI